MEAGFTPDDYYFDPEVDNAEQSILLLQNGQQTQVMGDSPDKMTYTEQELVYSYRSHSHTPFAQGRHTRSGALELS